MKKALILIFLIINAFTGFSQKKFDFRFWEDSLIKLRFQAMSAPTELERLAINEDFMNLLESIIWEPNSFRFPWDSVRNFSVVTSPDNLFKLFSWHIEKENFTVENFGFLQIYNDNRKKYVIYPLYDKRNTIDYPETMIGDHNQWYGAIYYKIIPLEAKNKTYYTLLGWNGNDLFSNQKIIEILSFKSDKSPIFGAKIFKKYSDKVSRIILTYNKESSLSLKFERQSYDVGTARKDPKTKKTIYETVDCDMIIFDKLIPMEVGMDKIPAFMIPESSMQQGFVADNGKWLYIETVKGRNPDKPLPPHEIKQRDFYNPNKSKQ